LTSPLIAILFATQLRERKANDTETVVANAVTEVRDLRLLLRRAVAGVFRGNATVSYRCRSSDVL